jgi:microtubule-associated protein-like 6
VKLFNYPVVIEEAPHRAYRGHSSHVMCVRFNADDSIVCSAGGKDWGLFQFRCAARRAE